MRLAKTSSVCMLRESDRVLFAQLTKSGELITRACDSSSAGMDPKAFRRVGFKGRHAISVIGLDQCRVTQQKLSNHDAFVHSQNSETVAIDKQRMDDEYACRDALMLVSSAQDEEVVVIEADKCAVRSATSTMREHGLVPLCLDAYELAIVRGIHAVTAASSPDIAQLLCVVYPGVVAAVLFHADCAIHMVRLSSFQGEAGDAGTRSSVDRIAHEIDMIALYSSLHASSGMSIDRIHLAAPDGLYRAIRDEVISRVVLPCCGLGDLTRGHPLLSELVEHDELTPAGALAMLGMLQAASRNTIFAEDLRCA